MNTDDERFAAVMNSLKTRGPEQRQRKKHRLPMDCYTASDCEFLFTVCARHQGLPFSDAKLAQAIVESLLWRKRDHNWTLLVYCLMPDHLHFILRLPPQPIRQFNAGARGIVTEGVLDQVGNFKKYTATQIWWRRGGAGKLWQRSSYDRVLQYDKGIEPAIHYVLNNPVRKGLVEHWDQYPYSAIVDEWQRTFAATFPFAEMRFPGWERNGVRSLHLQLPATQRRVCPTPAMTDHVDTRLS